MSSTYQNNGQYVLEEFIIDPTENRDEREFINLIPLLIECNIYESIEDMTMSGSVSIIDASAMDDIFPLDGNERISIRFHTAGNESNPIEYEALIYKISPKHRVTEHSNGFTIYFSSEASILSTRSFVHSGFSDTTDRIVDNIYRQYLTRDIRKPLETTSARGICNHTFGAITPLEAISVLERYASSTQGDAAYVFFENNRSFVFKPLQELYQQEPVASYKYGLSGVYENVDKKNEEAFERIQGIKVKDENSFSDKMMDGLYGSKHCVFDLVTKTFLGDSSVLYNKDEWFDENRSLGKYPSRKKQESREDIIKLSYGSGPDDLILQQDRIESKMKRAELDLFIAEIMVFGDSKIKCGDVIEGFIPNLNMDQKNIINPFSGKFLITSICHNLVPSKYTQTFQIQKDAYEVIIP